MIVITLICSACVYKIDVKDILSLKILEKVLILFFTLKKMPNESLILPIWNIAITWFLSSVIVDSKSER